MTPDQLTEVPGAERDDALSCLKAQLAAARLDLEDESAARRAAEQRARTAEAALLAVRSVVDAVR